MDVSGVELMNAKSMDRREGHFEGYNGTELLFQSWSSPKARATLVVTHGMAEHSECYSAFAEKIVPLGWNVFAWDLRGHGRSEGKRGFVEDFHHYSRDLAHFIGFLNSTGRLTLPYALVGHSMGGLITLRYLLEEKSAGPEPMGLALSSPLLGVALAVPAIKDFAARALNRFLPSITLNNEIKYEDLIRDPELHKKYEADPLRHDRVSPSLYLGILANTELVKSRAGEVKIPTLVQAAGQEKIVSLPAIRDFFEKIGAEKKKLIVYDESYHEIYNDLDRDRVFHDLDAFLSTLL